MFFCPKGQALGLFWPVLQGQKSDKKRKYVNQTLGQFAKKVKQIGCKIRFFYKNLRITQKSVRLFVPLCWRTKNHGIRWAFARFFGQMEAKVCGKRCQTTILKNNLKFWKLPIDISIKKYRIRLRRKYEQFCRTANHTTTECLCESRNGALSTGWMGGCHRSKERVLCDAVSHPLFHNCSATTQQLDYVNLLPYF